MAEYHRRRRGDHEDALRYGEIGSRFGGRDTAPPDDMPVKDTAPDEGDQGELLVLSPPNLAEQIAEVERELGQRSRVYPRLVESGRLSASRALAYTASMRAVLATLRGLRPPRA